MAVKLDEVVRDKRLFERRDCEFVSYEVVRDGDCLLSNVRMR